MRRPVSAWCGALSLLHLCVSACGGSGGDTGSGSQANTGQVTDAWRSYCVAKFTANYDARSFGDPLFTAHAGEEYLMTEYDAVVGHAGLAYLTAVGPYPFDIDVTGDTPAFPLTTNCASASTKSYYAAFTDVTFYATKDLSTKLCAVSAGTALPRDTGTNAGYATTTLSFSGPTTYEVQLNAFSAQCGAPSGFVSVPETQVFGTTTWLVPVMVIIGPQ
jgi:hypothetical protein